MENSRYIGLDWIKMPMYKSAWHSFRSQNLLNYYLDRADRVNGFISNTINISVVKGDSYFDGMTIQLDIAPMCAAVEETALYLSKLQIIQLGLECTGEYHTKNYGTVNTYSGVKMRLDSPNCQDFEYEIPDGFVYELPEIFCSASMVSVDIYGIPQRQGIVHRELFYNHAIISFKDVLYAMSNRMFQTSGIPEVMSSHPHCRISTGKGQWVDLNTSLRRMNYSVGPDGVHPSLLDDFYFDEKIRPPIIYFKVTPKCAQCKKTQDIFYCPLCRKRHVQTPHVYCSKICQKLHWDAEHCDFHADSVSEQRVIVTPISEAQRTALQHSEPSRTQLKAPITVYSYEYYVLAFFSFYVMCWLLLHHGSVAPQHEDL